MDLSCQLSVITKEMYPLYNLAYFYIIMVSGI